MDKMKQWALLTAVAILAVAVGGWFLLISPQRSHASSLRTGAQAQHQKNDELRAEIASLQAQHKDLPQVQAALAKLGVQLPNNPALPALIRSLSAAADAAGVDLVSLAPTEPAPVTAPSAAPVHASSQAAAVSSATSATATTSTASANAPVSASGVGSLDSIGLTVVVNGGYFQVEQFVSNLEAFTRPFLTTSIQMAPQKPARPSITSATAAAPPTAVAVGPTYDGHVQATIAGQVFMLGAPPAPTTTATAAPTTATK